MSDYGDLSVEVPKKFTESKINDSVIFQKHPDSGFSFVLVDVEVD